MTTRVDANEFQEELQRLEAMLHEAEEVADPAARGRLQNIVQAVLHLHGVGLERLLEIVADSGDQGQKIVDACGADDVVSGLLLLHGLHPADARDRVMTALESVRPMLHSQGGNVELVEFHGETVRLRLLRELPVVGCDDAAGGRGGDFREGAGGDGRRVRRRGIYVDVGGQVPGGAAVGQTSVIRKIHAARPGKNATARARSASKVEGSASSASSAS